jgi:ABC-type transport system substrate-binding protein
VSLAVDREALAAALAGTPATGLVPPATPGWSTGSGAGRTGADATCRACVHDPAKARSLFARSKAGRAAVTLAVPPGAEARQVAALLADDLDAAGADLSVTPAPTGQTPLTLVRRVAPYPRPDPFLSASSSTSPTIQRLLDQARATPDDPTRTTRYHQTEAAILADLAATPLLTEHHAAVLTPGPQGFNLTPWGTLDLTTISLPA